MLFNTLQFVVFYIIVASLYYNLPHKKRWIMLLAASCYFYLGFYPFYIIVMFGIITISYFAALMLEKNSYEAKKILITTGISLVTGILLTLKYSDSLNDFVIDLLFGGTKLPKPLTHILLPIGLSFHTFQVIAYMIEVYRGNVKAERNFGIFSLYVMFFPQLVAGPIERPQNLLLQFKEKNEFDFDNFKSGLMLMAFGYFKKVVVADRLGIAVDSTYNSAASHTGSELLIATILYSFQIYIDFSAYTEIAIGSARIMGFKLTNNFKSPYFSNTITEFWARWHISLSTWLRDYLFLPSAYYILRIIRKKWLGMKPEIWSYVLATMFTMFIAGLWHGDSLAFVIWGLLHGFYLVLAFAKKRIYKRYHVRTSSKTIAKLIRVCITFFLVSFAWIFFRAGDTATSFLIIKKIFSFSVFSLPGFSLNGVEMIFSIILILLILLKERMWNEIKINFNFAYWLVFTAIILLCYFFGVFDQKQFIYFQF